MLSKRHAISDQTTLTDAVRILKEIQLTGLPSVDDSEHVVGFLSEQDCIKQILESSYHRDEVIKLTKVMQPNVLSVAPVTAWSTLRHE